MKHTIRFTVLTSVVWAGVLHAQAPTITSVTNESGSGPNTLCPGGVAFVQGTNLGGANATVLVGAKQAYVINAVSGTSLQVQLPVDAPTGASTVKVGASAPFNITLVQYCPGLAINNNLPAAFHFSNGPSAPVTASFPATPNEQLAVVATGLGPTNPAYATGTVPKDFNAVTLVMPTVNVAGKAITPQAAFLVPNSSPGFYFVVFTIRSDVPSGPQSISISIGGVTSNAAQLPFTTGPVVVSVSNAASYITVGPSRGIAQGAIFVIKGINLGPADISIAKNPFQDTNLSGTSVSVTSNGTKVAALMYYTSATQVAALLPSNTPVSTNSGSITVTYNGQAGPAAPIVVVPNTLGIFTVTSDGNGAGIVTFPDYSLVSTAKAANCGGVYTTCGAANPGDVLTIWATGLGPITGSDAAGDGIGVNMPNIPLTLWLGGVQADVQYQGRGCCIGEDQINFTVPANTPLGCDVPLTVQIANSVSNSVALPVAAAGSRTCTPTDPAFTAANVAQVASLGNSTFTLGLIDLKRNDNYPNGGFQDVVHGQFLRLGIDPARQPFFFSYLDVPPVGACQLYNSVNGSPNPPIASVAPLDAGPQITVQGPLGSQNVADSGGEYKTIISSGKFLSAGMYTVSAPGGADVPKFSTSVTVPQLPVMTNPPPDAANPFTVTRANGLTVTWSGGSPNGFIELDGFSATDNTYTNGISFTCIVSAASGTFTIPPSITLGLPANNFGGLDFHPAILPVNLTGTGLNLTQLAFQYDYFTPLTFK